MLLRRSLIYFAEVESNDHIIKIGNSRALTDRMSSLSRYYGLKLKILAVVPCGEGVTENHIHTLFKDLRVPRTEFFIKSPKLMAFISKHGVRPEAVAGYNHYAIYTELRR